MNFKIFLNLILIFGLFQTISAQENKSEMQVAYRMKFISDSLKMDNFVYVDNLILLFNNRSSIYYSQDAKDYYQYLNKGISQMKDGVISLGSLPPVPKVKGSVYRNDDVITAILPVGKYLYSFEEPKILWTLLNDTKTIKGIVCRLAKAKVDTGDTFFAWYATKDYPYPEGPFRFKGLPGLILSVYNANKTIEIDAVDIRKSSDQIINEFGNMSIKIKNKDVFIKARNEFFDNPDIQKNRDVIFKDGNGNIINNKNTGKLPNNVFLD